MFTILLTAISSDLFAQPTASFKVLGEVAVEAPTKFGINVHIPSEFVHWKGMGKVNLWSRGGHPEGFYTVVKGVATNGGADYLENTERPWASFWGTYLDGFFDGATIRIYRYAGDRAFILREDEVVRFEGGKQDSANRFTLADSGPEIREGDEYVVFRNALSSGPGLARQVPGQPDLLTDLYSPRPETARVVIDPKTAAPWGGRTSLRVELPQPGGVSVSAWYLEPRSAGWTRFDPESTFRFQGWFKQAPGGKGDLIVRCGALAEKRFPIGSEWEHIRFDFPGGQADNARNALDFELTAPGTLWVDNFAVFETGEAAPKPLGFYPDMVEALKRFRPGFLRIWQLQNNKGSVPPLRTMLGGYFEQPWIFDRRKLETFNMIDLHPMLELCEAVGAKPWIIVSTFYTEQEWADLVEYLAGPADSPMGALRASRGREAPWTETFDKIWLESGNETWNGTFRPQNFPNRPEDYGRYSNLHFAAAKASPHFDEDVFHFVTNGFSGSIDGFTKAAAESAPLTDYVDIANYIGGWDAGGTDTGADGDLAYQSRLLYGVTEGKQTVEAFSAMLETVNEARGQPLRGAVYEAGPGYSLPGPDVEIDWGEQHLGKSLASAIGTLDQYFNYTAAGVDLIGHFTFGRGLYWYSHAESSDQWRPHAVTLACMLRNEYGQGDLLNVETIQRPGIDLPARVMLRKRNDGSIRKRPLPAAEDVPLVACYAFRDGERFAVFLISRTFEGDTTVQVDLPWKVADAVEIARLSGASPMAHNTDENQVRIEKTVTTNFDFDAIHLPAHCVQVISGRITESRAGSNSLR